MHSVYAGCIYSLYVDADVVPVMYNIQVSQNYVNK